MDKLMMDKPHSGQSDGADLQTPAHGPWPGFIVFIDAECTFCSNSAAWMLAHDAGGQIHIAALQGNTATRILPELGVDEEYLHRARTDNSSIDGILCVVNPGRVDARLYQRSRASRMIARRMSFPWNVLGGLSWWVPDFLLDPLYGIFKRRRHSLAKSACALPPPELQARYLD